jgi:hypothetical protein
MAANKDQPKQRTPKGLEIPVPKRGQVMDFIDRVSGRASRKRPAEKVPPQKQPE